MGLNFVISKQIINSRLFTAPKKDDKLTAANNFRLELRKATRPQYLF